MSKEGCGGRKAVGVWSACLKGGVVAGDVRSRQRESG